VSHETFLRKPKAPFCVCLPPIISWLLPNKGVILPRQVAREGLRLRRRATPETVEC